MSSNPLLRVLTGLTGNRRVVEAVIPRRTFDDVILPPDTRRALEQALQHVTRHDLIFNRWGLGERHPTGLSLAFNFAGPPGTGKTICAEALANSLGRPLLIVRYAEVESMWMGDTPKNVAAVFRIAREENAVLLFDEADAIAARRSSSVEHGFLREMNSVVNVLLQELERFDGVVVFATNLAANFDPAFERRLRTHVLFEMPGPDEREQIWRVQMHPTLTPVADDVDFRALAERYEVTGGDIRNAVLKAAMAAAGEPGRDASKAIHQRHLEAGIQDVLSAKKVMKQSLFLTGAESASTVLTGPPDAGHNTLEALRALAGMGGRHSVATLAMAATALVLSAAALAVALLG